jgi:hypothetical protein
VSLDLSFMSAGTLPSGVTFTRLSSATYFDSSGTLQTAATNVPRWDYHPTTNALQGLLIEEARTNPVLNSGNAATWGVSGAVVATPTVTANQTTAPDGTLTAARAAYPAVPAAGNFSNLVPIGAGLTATVAPYVFSAFLKGSVGGEQLYLSATPDGGTYYRSAVTLTTAWQRFVLVTPNLTAVPWYFLIGTDRRDAGQAATLAQTIYVWGAQIEAGGFVTSYIPTTGVSVTRAADNTLMPTAAWFSASQGTVVSECIFRTVPLTQTTEPVAIGSAPSVLIRAAFGASSPFVQVFNGGGSLGGPANTELITLGVSQKHGFTYNSSSLVLTSVLNGHTVVSATASGAFGAFTTLYIGGNGRGLPLNGTIGRVRYWPRALTNAELQSVTT